MESPSTLMHDFPFQILLMIETVVLPMSYIKRNVAQHTAVTLSVLDAEPEDNTFGNVYLSFHPSICQHSYD